MHHNLLRTSEETTESFSLVCMANAIDKIVVFVRLHTGLDRVKRELSTALAKISDIEIIRNVSILQEWSIRHWHCLHKSQCGISSGTFWVDLHRSFEVLAPAKYHHHDVASQACLCGLVVRSVGVQWPL